MIKYKGIEEKKTSGYIAYILSQEAYLYEIGYKGIQTNNGVNLLPCYKLFFNGKLMLMFHTQSLISLDYAASTFSPEAYVGAVLKLLKGYHELKECAFVKMETVDISIHSIFFDVNTLSPFFLYIPINVNSQSDSYYTALQDLKNNITNLIHTKRNLQSEVCSQLERELTNQRNSLDSIINNISWLSGNTDLFEKKADPLELSSIPDNQDQVYDTNILTSDYTSSIALVSLNHEHEIVIDQPEFKIGRKTDGNHYVIADNRNISNYHCKVLCVDGKNYIIDTKSTNGVRINDIKIDENVAKEIKPGDKVSLADLDFMVSNIAGIHKSIGGVQ